MVIVMIITMTNEAIKFKVKTKRCETIVCLSNDGLKVILCNNREKCLNMGITSCPPFCDKISALKQYLRSGKRKAGYEIIKID